MNETEETRTEEMQKESEVQTEPVVMPTPEPDTPPFEPSDAQPDENAGFDPGTGNQVAPESSDNDMNDQVDVEADGEAS
jgi:hypothetical protein